jgi:hypothetical protein
MANIKKDVDITDVTVAKKRHKFTGLNYDSSTDIITIGYDVIALSPADVELFKHSVGIISIPSSRFAEPLIAAFLTAGQNLIVSELPSV